MNCQDAKNLIAVCIFGRLTRSQQDGLEEHLSTCRSCARRYERSSHLVDLEPESTEIPLPDPEDSWKVISARALGRRRKPVLVPVRKYALAACALLIVFTLGYFIGRRVLSSGPPALDTFAADVSGASFASYAENLKPVLVNFLNRDGVQTPENIRHLEQQMINEMLVRTRLLKILAAESGDPVLGDLLQDLEFILTAMDNLRPGDRESARHLSRMIQERRISLRLHELITAKSII